MSLTNIGCSNRVISFVDNKRFGLVDIPERPGRKESPGRQKPWVPYCSPFMGFSAYVIISIGRRIILKWSLVGVVWFLLPVDTIKNSGVTLVVHSWLTDGTTPNSSRRILLQKTVRSLRHHVAWLLTGQWLLPNRDLYRERPSVSFFKFHYLLFSCRPSSSCWHLLPRVRTTSPFYLSFNNAFRKAVPTHDVGLPSLYCV